jgi:hypothetical protein
MAYSLSFYDTCNIEDLIIGITIPSTILLLTFLFPHSLIFHPCDLVTCCNIGYNFTKWAQSIFSQNGRTNPALGAHASTYSIGIPKETFLVTVLPSDG